MPWLCVQVTDSARFDRSITSAVTYLQGQLNAISSDPYALNIVSYALTLARSSLADVAVEKLSGLAKTEGFMHFMLSCVRQKQLFYSH